jgi:hypothetical protein
MPFEDHDYWEGDEDQLQSRMEQRVGRRSIAARMATTMSRKMAAERSRAL